MNTIYPSKGLNSLSLKTLIFSPAKKKKKNFCGMAADVSTLVRDLNGYKDDRMVGNDSSVGKSMALITRDLLGGGGGSPTRNESKELDLDLHVPNGWEKCLDLKVHIFVFCFFICFCFNTHIWFSQVSYLCFSNSLKKNKGENLFG